MEGGWVVEVAGVGDEVGGCDADAVAAVVVSAALWFFISFLFR